MCTFQCSTVTIFKPDKSGWNCWRDKLVLEPNSFDPQKNDFLNRVGLDFLVMTSYQRWWWKTYLKHLRTSKWITSLRIGVQFWKNIWNHLKKISHHFLVGKLLFPHPLFGWFVALASRIPGSAPPKWDHLRAETYGILRVSAHAGDTFMTWSAGNP